jgi:hypothetical protein
MGEIYTPKQPKDIKKRKLMFVTEGKVNRMGNLNWRISSAVARHQYNFVLKELTNSSRK